jgi:hypothetical protein
VSFGQLSHLQVESSSILVLALVNADLWELLTEISEMWWNVSSWPNWHWGLVQDWHAQWPCSTLDTHRLHTEAFLMKYKRSFSQQVAQQQKHFWKMSTDAMRNPWPRYSCMKTVGRASCEHSLVSTPNPDDRPPFQQTECRSAIPSFNCVCKAVSLALRLLQLPARSCPSLLRWLQACSRPSSSR